MYSFHQFYAYQIGKYCTFQFTSCHTLIFLIEMLLYIMTKGASALGTRCALNAHSIHIDRVRTRNGCALNAHSIHIDRVRTRNVKVSNWIEYALSQSTSLCGLNPVTSGLEWNVGGRSLRHMTSVHRRSRMTSVRGT